MWFKSKSDDAGRIDAINPAEKPVPSAPVAPAAAAPAAAASPPPVSAAAETGEALSTEVAKQRAMQAKMVAASFGEIVTLLMRTPAYRLHAIQDIEWLIGPALLTGQFAIVEAQAKQTGVVTPVGAVLWAMVSPEVDARLSKDVDQPIRLTPQEWRSGTIPWIVLTLGDQNVVAGILRQLATNVFKTEPARLRARGEDGRVGVGRLSAEPAAAAAGSA
jgi:hemolysin-activating ACP:hemolysin acyltransferase